ncbi:MAG: ABC transporter substrate-binding protein [Bacillota bacterium]|nr:ABC transporter substrate-binding protein [Bacillota bacterium]
MKRKLSVLLSLLLSSTVLLTSCVTKNTADSGKTSTDSNVIKIGVMEPITGANAAGGALELEGIKLANKLYPEVLGKKVELVIVDNKSEKVEAANAANRLVDKEKVTAILGSWGSSLSMAAGDTVKNAKVPAIGTSCTNPLVTKGNDFYFRVCFIDPFQGTVMANYAFNKLGAKKVAIIQEISNDYAVGLAKYFKDSFIKLTGDPNSVVTITNYNTGDQDFSGQLTTVKSKNPDLIFAPGNFTESALLIKQARQLGMTTKFIGGDTWETPEFISIGKEAVEGATFSTFFAEELFKGNNQMTDETTKFLEAFRKEYNHEPAAVAALGYDAYILALDAIKRANSTDTVKVRDAIAKTKDFPGAAGKITLDENGDAVKFAVIKTVKDGKFTYLDIVNP